MIYKGSYAQRAYTPSHGEHPHGQEVISGTALKGLNNREAIGGLIIMLLQSRVVA
jgi:hypothetical protein